MKPPLQRPWLRRLGLLLACLLPTPILADAQEVGEITRYRGGAFAINEGESRNLAEGSALLQGDRIVTGQNTRLEMTMIDGAVITLGDFTYFKLEEYRFDEQQGTGNGNVSLLQGVFRAVTGKLAQLQNKPFRVVSSLATIGIRGTDFWGEQTPQKFEIALLDGEAIFIRNQQGEVTIDQIGYGTTILPGQPPTEPKAWGQGKLARAAGTVD